MIYTIHKNLVLIKNQYSIYRGAEHSTCNIKHSVTKKILVVFHNGSNYDYHFIIKELAGEFKKQFTCLG